MKKKQINIIGAGCAGLSLARFSKELKEYQFTLVYSNQDMITFCNKFRDRLSEVEPETNLQD